MHSVLARVYAKLGYQNKVGSVYRGAYSGVEKYEKELNLLERGNLVKGKLKYTERNAYREYQLTKKGSELVNKLQKET